MITPVMPMASDALSSAEHTTAVIPRSAPEMSHRPARWCRTAWCGAPIRIAMRSGLSSGRASVIWRARSQLTRAAAMSRLVDHRQRACASSRRREVHRRRQVLSDQRSVLVDRFRVTRLNRGGHAPVQLGAIGFKLRFVGHRTDQRMVKDILGLAGEPDLIDEFGCHQVSNRRFDPERSQQVQGRTASR